MEWAFPNDDNGNLATKTDRVTLAVTSYSYDAQDQLIRIDLPESMAAVGSYGPPWRNFRDAHLDQLSGQPALVQARSAASAAGLKSSPIGPSR